MEKTTLGDKPVLMMTLKRSSELFDEDKSDFCFIKRFGFLYVIPAWFCRSADHTTKDLLDFYCNVRIKTSKLVLLLTEGGMFKAGSGYTDSAELGKIGYGNLTVRLTKRHAQIVAPCGEKTSMTLKQARDLAEAVVSL